MKHGECYSREGEGCEKQITQNEPILLEVEKMHCGGTKEKMDSCFRSNDEEEHLL